MLYDYVSREDRLKPLQQKKCGWRCLFSRFKRNKKKKMIKNLNNIKFMSDDRHLSGCKNRKKGRTWVFQCCASQSIWVNENIQIVILSTFKGVTHIGIEAPPEIKIIKSECQHTKHFGLIEDV